VQEKPDRLKFINKVMDNPIIAKELKSRMRGRQGFILLTAYLLLISLVIVSVYYYSVGDWNAARITPDALAETGKRIFGMVVLFEFALILFIGPALTSGAISSERERGTFDLLRASLLSSRELVLGKLGAAVAYLLLLILAALPLQSLAFFLGGVGMAEMVVSLVMLTVSAFFFCVLGLYFSSIARKTSTANILAYGSMLLPVIVGGLLYYLLGNGDIDLASASIAAQRVGLVGIWTFLSITPFTAAIVSELMLTEEQSLFIFAFPDVGYPIVLFSPWILYTVFAVTMTLLMIWLIVFYMNRHER